jgi:hypothetical protein
VMAWSGAGSFFANREPVDLAKRRVILFTNLVLD